MDTPQQHGGFKSLVLYLLSQGSGFIIPLVTFPVFTRLIDVERYGVIDMLSIAVIAGMALGNWGFSSAYNRFYFAYGTDAKKQDRLLGTMVGITLLLGAVVCVVVALLQREISVFLTQSDEWGPLLVMLVVGRYLQSANMFFFNLFRNVGQAGRYFWSDLFKRLLWAGIALAMIAGFRKGIWGLGVSQLVAEGLQLLIFGYVFRRRLFHFDLSILKECFRFCWPLSINVFAGVLNQSIDKFMIGTTLSLALLGVYGRALSIAYMMFMFMTAVLNVYTPRWNRLLFKLEDFGGRTLGSMFTEYVAIIMVPAAMLCLFAREAIIILAPPKYHGAAPFIILLGAHFACLTFSTLNGPILSYLHRSKTNGAVRVISTIANVLLNLWAIPRFGVWGAVGATIVACHLPGAFMTWLVTRYYQVTFEKRPLILMYGLLLLCIVAGMFSYYQVLPVWPDRIGRVVLLALVILVCGQVVGWQRVFRLLKHKKIGSAT